MKDTTLRILLVMLISSITYSMAHSEESWCKVSTDPVNNVGRCYEGLDGKGKCAALSIEELPFCSDDQPEEEIIF